MRRLLAAALLAAIASGVPAQEAAPSGEPVAAVSVRDSSALTFAQQGGYLIIADGAQLQLYDLSDVTSPQQVAIFDLENPPAALAATSHFDPNFALVLAVHDDANYLVVITSDPYSKLGFGIVNFVDAPADPRGIALSPDNRWALVSGADGYRMMALGAADDIQVSALFETGDAPLIAAALTDESALLIREDRPRIDSIPLSTSGRVTGSASELPLDAQPTAISVNADASLGVVALDDNRLVLFDPNALTSLNVVSLDDGPVTEMRFIAVDERVFLALVAEERPAVTLLDVTDPADVSPPGSLAVNGAALALAVYDPYIAVSDGEQVTIFQLVP